MRYDINPLAIVSIDKLVPTNHLPKYPKCIVCGMIVSQLKKDIDYSMYEIEFNGQLTDSKSKPILNVSIIVICKLFSIEDALGTDVEIMLQAAYSVAKKSFEDKVSRDSIMNSYSLCPVDNFGLSPHFFR